MLNKITSKRDWKWNKADIFMIFIRKCVQIQWYSLHAFLYKPYKPSNFCTVASKLTRASRVSSPDGIISDGGSKNPFFPVSRSSTANGYVIFADA